jgi:predicted transposase YbfD/YdcC
MANLIADSLLSSFHAMEDPRNPRGRIHSLPTILTIALVATICGCDEWTEIEAFGKAKERLFTQTFGVAHQGIPSHDTFGRVFALIKPQAFRECFAAWMKTLAKVSGQIAIDGKAMRGSFDTFAQQLNQHIVSAYASGPGMVLGQVPTDQKSNEITAIPQLLKLLDLESCIVTIDAMGTQTAIAQYIESNKGDYVLAVKGNQPTLDEEVRESFEKVGVKDDATVIEHTEADHGRLEKRRYTVCPVDGYLTPDLIAKWPGLSTMVMADSHTEFINGRRLGEERSDRRFFITSLAAKEAEAIASSIRGQWSIENSLHYTLDVAFREDYNRTRKGHAATNQAVVRHAALNLLKNEKTAKVGIKTKRKIAGWDDAYLFKLLRGG